MVHAPHLGVLKVVRELLHDLPQAVQELQKHWRPLLVAVVAARVAADPRPVALGKLEPKRAPLLLDQHGQATKRAWVRVEDDLRQRRELRRTIPAVAAVHQHRHAALQELGDAYTASEYDGDQAVCV